MAINKVEFGGDTLIDLTGDNAVASQVLDGRRFHLRNGTQTTGTMANIGIKTVDLRAFNYPEDIVDGYVASLRINTTLSGNASTSQVLSGSTFYSNSVSSLRTGTMPNIGAVTETISAGDTYTIPEGYHDGTGTVTATGGGGSIAVVYANGGGNTSSAYNSSVLDVGEVGNTCYYQFGGGGANAKTFSVQGSLNNSSWTTITSTSNSANRITGFTGNNSEYRYYRLHVNAGTASATNGYRGMMACIDLGGNSTNAFSPVEETM